MIVFLSILVLFNTNKSVRDFANDAVESGKVAYDDAKTKIKEATQEEKVENK